MFTILLPSGKIIYGLSFLAIFLATITNIMILHLLPGGYCGKKKCRDAQRGRDRCDPVDNVCHVTAYETQCPDTASFLKRCGDASALEG